MAAGSAAFLLMALAGSFMFGHLACAAFFEAGGPIVMLRRVGAALGALWKRVLKRFRGLALVSRWERGRAGERRRRQARREMPQALRLMCLSLNAGSSLTGAIDQVAQGQGIVAQEFKRVAWDLQAGHGFDEAMERLRTRWQGNEFSHLCVAMEIQHRCGGSLSAVLEVLLDSLQQRTSLYDELLTKTAQARFSAQVVSVMSLAILTVLSLLSPGYLESFFGSSLGVALFVLALVLEGAGVIAVKSVSSPKRVLGGDTQ